MVNLKHYKKIFGKMALDSDFFKSGLLEANFFGFNFLVWIQGRDHFLIPI
jgi:hypothetical protein